MNKNYIIVSVEGLDVSGKETFATELYNIISTMYRMSKNVKVYYHSFPTYDSAIGEKISEALRQPKESRPGLDELNELFYKDREVVMAKYQNMFNDNPNNLYILILDRYYLSTLMYSLAVEGTDKPLNTTNAFKTYMKEHEELPNPDHTVIFARLNDKSTKLHQELIKGKMHKDNNETEEFQVKVNNSIVSPNGILNNSVTVFRHPYDTELVNTIVTSIGDNFVDKGTLIRIIEYINSDVIDFMKIV